MQSIVIIQKDGIISSKKVKDITMDNLYLKCGFKTSNNFLIRHSFKIEDYNIHVYAKDKGKSNMINKFDFPPPIDNDVYYGNVLIIKINNTDPDCIEKYTAEDWEADYEKLMGGFKDINTDDADDTSIINGVPGIDDKDINKKHINKIDKDDKDDNEDIGNEVESTCEEDLEADINENNEDNDDLNDGDFETETIISDNETEIDYIENATVLNDSDDDEDSDDEFMSELEEEDYINED
jgi:hypothetical protein